MKKIILTTFLLCMTVVALAQDYTTPNTGVVWTLDDIAAASPTTITISGSDYSLLGNLTIAENDTVIIDTDLTLSIDGGKRVTVFGTFTVSANAVTITAIDTANPYDGFRFEQDSQIDIQNATIEYGGGLRVLTETFSIDHCTLTNNVSGTTSSAVIQLSRGLPQITNNTITFNELPAIGSAANADVSGLISNNYIEGNNTANANRPQINMGPTAGSDTLQIIQNTIIGDAANTKAGGIAIANFVGATVNVLIDGNTIQNNRYGITILGNVDSAIISNNVIEDNNIEGDPMMGGSGINLNASNPGNAVEATANEIRRNLWGITLQGEATINLGDDANNPGQNIFAENENGGQVYALYNNTANPVSAKHNCWIEGQESTAQDVEDVIYHQVDDSGLGLVTFEPFLCGVLGVDGFNTENFSFYPNPVKNEIHFNNNFSFENVEIFGLQGNLIVSETISEGNNTLSINLPPGIYVVKFTGENRVATQKMVVE